MIERIMASTRLTHLLGLPAAGLIAPKPGLSVLQPGCEGLGLLPRLALRPLVASLGAVCFLPAV